MKCSGSGGGKNRARDQNHFKSKSVDFDEIGKLNSKIQRSNAKTEPKRVINWHLNETAGLTKGVRKSIKKNEREAAAVGGLSEWTCNCTCIAFKCIACGLIGILLFMSRIVLQTDVGNITLVLLPRTSPTTCSESHVARHVKEGLYDRQTASAFTGPLSSVTCVVRRTSNAFASSGEI